MEDWGKVQSDAQSAKRAHSTPDFFEYSRVLYQKRCKAPKREREREKEKERERKRKRERERERS